MDVTEGNIAGLKIIRLKLFKDNRGFFSERFHNGRFTAAGLPPFVQDNHSYSTQRVLRGLHYQTNPDQGKLVGVIRGHVWDVAVDIRPDSPTLGKYEAIELSGENGTLFWIPPGFAHGFCVLGDEPADMFYKVSGHYSATGEGGIRYDDPDLNISWPIKNPIVSERDVALGSFKDYRASPPKWSQAA